jgi:hypothetical protein
VTRRAVSTTSAALDRGAAQTRRVVWRGETECGRTRAVGRWRRVETNAVTVRRKAGARSRCGGAQAEAMDKGDPELKKKTPGIDLIRYYAIHLK